MFYDRLGKYGSDGLRSHELWLRRLMLENQHPFLTGPRTPNGIAKMKYLIVNGITQKLRIPKPNSECVIV